MAICDRMKTALGAAASLALCGTAYAKDGQSVPWQVGFQPPATPIMAQIESFHTYVNIIIVLIALFVLALLIYVMARFNERRHPQPSPRRPWIRSGAARPAARPRDSSPPDGVATTLRRVNI